MDQEELFSKLVNATITNNLEIVKRLINKGVDIHYMDDVLLKFPSIHNNLKIVKYLVRQGSNFKADNERALRNAIKKGNVNVIKYLKSDAYIDNTLGPNYDYTKSRKLQIIYAIKKDPSIVDKLDKEELKKIPEIQSLIKGYEYGLFENRIMNFKKYIKQK